MSFFTSSFSAVRAVWSKARAIFSSSDASYSIQLVDKNGAYEDAAFENLCDKANLARFGVSYKIIAIIGPQSSGKSTLLNHMFHTNFQEMDAMEGRSQTTKGIWLGYSEESTHCTLVMDIEGSDGIERGEDNTMFENQTALFAFAVADVVLINIWCHEVGREKASMKSLLKIVFEAMSKLYNPRKITLLFVIRDKSETPLPQLDLKLRSTIREIWNSIPMKSSETRKYDISQFFNVEVVALSHYRYARNDFIREVSQLREQICGPETMSKKGDEVPDSHLPESFKRIWEEIKENKDIDVPSHKFTLAAHKCDEIRAEKLKSFLENQKLNELRKEAQRRSVDGLGAKLGDFINECLSRFDEATRHFDKNVKSVKQRELEEQLLESAREVYTSSMVHTRYKIWNQLKKDMVNLKYSANFAKDADDLTESALKQLDKASTDATPQQAVWNSLAIRNQLKNGIDNRVVHLQNSLLPGILKEYKEKMTKALGDHVKSLLLESAGDAWEQIREYSENKIGDVTKEYRLALSRYKVDQSTLDLNVKLLKDFGEGLVKETARVESENALNHMVERFFDEFSKDRDMSKLSKDDINQLANESRLECLKLLSVLAVIRLNEMVSSSFVEVLYNSLLRSYSNGEQLDSLENWRGVAAEHVLLTPPQCLQLWKAFIEKASFSLRQKSAWGNFFDNIIQVAPIIIRAVLQFVQIWHQR